MAWGILQERMYNFRDIQMFIWKEILKIGRVHQEYASFWDLLWYRGWVGSRGQLYSTLLKQSTSQPMRLVPK